MRVSRQAYRNRVEKSLRLQHVEIDDAAAMEQRERCFAQRRGGPTIIADHNAGDALDLTMPGAPRGKDMPRGADAARPPSILCGGAPTKGCKTGSAAGCCEGATFRWPLGRIFPAQP